VSMRSFWGYRDLHHRWGTLFFKVLYFGQKFLVCLSKQLLPHFSAGAGPLGPFNLPVLVAESGFCHLKEKTIRGTSYDQ